MPYQIGSAPPGLRGMLLSRANRQADQQAQLQAMQGALGMQGLLMQQQMMPIQLEKARLEMQKAKELADLKRQIFGNIAGGQQAGGQPVEGGISTPTGPSTFNGQPAPQAPSLGLPPQVQLGLLSGDPGLKAWAQELAKVHAPTDKIREAIALGMRPGTPEFNSFIGRMATQGGIWNPAQGGGVQLAPGFAEGTGAIRRAEEQARADFAIQEIHDGRGGTISVPRSDALRLLKQQPPTQTPTPPTTPAPAGRPPAEQAAIAAVQAASARGKPASVDVGPYDPSRRGPIPSDAVIGRNPSQAEQAADRERLVGLEKLALEKPDAEQRVTEISSAMARLKETAEDLLRDPNLHFATGIGTPVSYLPGTPAAKTRAKFETLKSQIGLAVLRALREASKTGGALGQVSNFENVMMQQNIDALSRAQRPQDLQKALISVIEYANGASDRVTGAFEKTYGEKFQPPAKRGVEQPKVINFGDL